MWEVTASGTLHESLGRGVPRAASVAIAFFREDERGRRVAVTARGEPQAARRGVSRLLPGLVRESATPLVEGASTVRGFLPQPSGDGFWTRLARFEAAWLGSWGSLACAEVRGDALRVVGLLESMPSGPPKEAALCEASTTSGLFAAGPLTSMTLAARLGDGAGASHSEAFRPMEIETGRVALAMGYYERPRRCTMEDIAATLGITKSAVFHRMHGLERKAVERLLKEAGVSPAPQRLPAVEPVTMLQEAL